MRLEKSTEHLQSSNIAHSKERKGHILGLRFFSSIGALFHGENGKKLKKLAMNATFTRLRILTEDNM